MLSQYSTPCTPSCGNIVLDEETIILITFFRSNRFTYVKLHNRLLHYAAHMSKQIAEETLRNCSTRTSQQRRNVYHLGSGSRIYLKTYLLYLAPT